MPLTEGPLQPICRKVGEEGQGPEVQRVRTRALLAVSQVGSTARRVMVPAVTTCGRMAP